jgi:undecaprenyl-diphosphatase
VNDSPGAGRVRPGTRLFVEAALAVLGLLVFVSLARSFVRGGQVVALDDDVARRVAEGVPGAVEWTARLFTYAGGTAGTVIVAGAAVALLWRAGRQVDALFLGVAVAGVLLLVPVLKVAYERARPDLGSPIRLPHSYSFPSGHAATAVVLYGALAILLAERSHSRRRAAGWLAAAAAGALAIGASRVLLNVHFVSDVVAGFAVGLAWLCCSAIAREVAAGRRSVADRS